MVNRADVLPVSLAGPHVKDGRQVLALLKYGEWAVARWKEMKWYVVDMDGDDSHYSEFYKDEDLVGIMELENSTIPRVYSLT